jgi:hypothetical protein
VQDDAPPGEAEIRRALAECMTVEDIDDAMGWPRGTARRRRWAAADRGGLPFADAELGGIALWFRSTFEAWRVAGPDRVQAGQRSRRRRSPLDGLEPAASAGGDVLPAATPEVDRIDEQLVGDAEVEDPSKGGAKPPDSVDDDRRDALQDVQPDDEVNRPTLEPPTAPIDDIGEQPNTPDSRSESNQGPSMSGVGGVAGVRSGFELDDGQRVLAEIHGRWQEARVSRRDRTTVVVEYEVDQTRLGGRVQRVDIGRIRVAGQRPESEEEQGQPPQSGAGQSSSPG